MKPIQVPQLIPALSALLLLAVAAPSPRRGARARTPSLGGAAAQTDAALRDLWVGHVFWVRNVVRETLAGSHAAAAAAETEVVANARQIAGAIEPFYGKAATDRLFELLAGHYGAVRQYLDATAAGSKAGQDEAHAALTANAAEIARFLSGANPNLPYDTVNGLLLAHGGHHVQQIQQIKAGQFAEEARTWNDDEGPHVQHIADALAGAIAQAVPGASSWRRPH
ncbi:MAG: hypothetical protein MZV70_37455 [Desulfobacterales bacterium]|nr:hypothetical protein [Desulfobacterales bacterium]